MTKKEAMVRACEQFVLHYSDADSGPGHVVVSDYNFKPVHIKYCIELCEGALAWETGFTAPSQHLDALEAVNFYKAHTTQELHATQGFLMALLAWTEWEGEAV